MFSICIAYTIQHHTKKSHDFGWDMLHLKAVIRFWTISPRVPGLFPAEPLHGDSLKIGERLSLKLNTAAGLDGTGIAEPTESCT